MPRREPPCRATLRALAEIGNFFRSEREMRTVSIQIVDRANPASRKEVRERMRGALEAYRVIWANEGDNEEERNVKRGKAEDELKAFLFALTGQQPSEEELKEVIDG